MSSPASLSPTALPATALTSTGLTADGLWHAAFRAMASPVRVQLGVDTPLPERRLAEVRALFAEVERQCTRFDDASDLMRANAAGDAWTEVGGYCLAALEAAADAHAMTGGVFDPRVLRTLTELGYTGTLPFGTEAVTVAARDGLPRVLREPWVPEFDHILHRVRVGPEPIDLGGIGKGLALRWASDALVRAGVEQFLLDAGGDCVAAGPGPDGDGWRIGVEDPAGGVDPVAVLSVVDRACATSSTRLLRWHAGAEAVHHLIDPRTGQPGGGDLSAVTVVGVDPAVAEVWSKTLFLHAADIAAVAARFGLAALWVHTDGRYAMSESMRQYVIWESR